MITLTLGDLKICKRRRKIICKVLDIKKAPDFSEAFVK